MHNIPLTFQSMESKTRREFLTGAAIAGAAAVASGCATGKPSGVQF